MIKIEHTEVHGWEAAIRGMRNPLNSWEKSDSLWINKEGSCWDGMFFVGNNDLKLMKQLVNAGSDHSKFMRMITVTCNITAPIYFNKEIDTYKVGTVRNSCSTMHTIHKKEFEASDFSFEKTPPDVCSISYFLGRLNYARAKYLETNDKEYWYAIIQMLPESYNQRYTWQANYAVLRNIYHARKNHKLDEWRSFCEWVKDELPYSILITEE